MKEIYSVVEPKKLLHIVNRFSEAQGRRDLVPDENFLQAATINYRDCKTFLPHYHLWKKINYSEIITQESWVVIQGSVKVDFYDLDQSFICSEVLTNGDCSITLAGGHGYEILEKDTFIYEFKTGPYFGQSADKIYINQQI